MARGRAVLSAPYEIAELQRRLHEAEAKISAVRALLLDPAEAYRLISRKEILRLLPLTAAPDDRPEPVDCTEETDADRERDSLDTAIYEEARDDG
jgi:hypothetical protein